MDASTTDLKHNVEHVCMKRETAERLMTALLSLGGSLDEITSLTYEIDDETERRAFRKSVADAMHILSFDLVMHIVHQYSDLDPDKSK
jgi:hypothetical protein